ncbi:protein MANBAL isoform X2 [Narcine bancroftii]|uniref:protein MANBAL isoform X2 n=1 Tax=Narcine bancroftii TaxID=1343680 RepID=UPI003831A7DF
MATEFDLTPPEVPEPTLFDNVLRYGLFLAAIFQIVCILSILLPSKSSEPMLQMKCTNMDLQLNIARRSGNSLS